MKLVESMSRKAEIDGPSSLSAMKKIETAGGTSYGYRDDNGHIGFSVYTREDNGAWSWAIYDDRNDNEMWAGEDIFFDNPNDAFDDMRSFMKSERHISKKRAKRKGLAGNTYHQDDEIKHLEEARRRNMRSAALKRKVAGDWKADNEGNPDEKDTTWRKHDGDYQATVKWDDGGEKRYRWDVLDTDDRTVDSGHSDSIEDARSDADDALKSYMEDHKKESAAFKVAQEINELSNGADDLLDEDPDGVPAGQIAKAEWVASRMAERRMAKKINDSVLHHLAGMGCKVGMVACAKLTNKSAYAEYRDDVAKYPKIANRKPHMLSKESRYKAWATRKASFSDTPSIFVGAVSNPSNGDWLDLPASDDEIQKAIETAQTGPDGEFYEEVMISDTDGFDPGEDIEYMPIEAVNDCFEVFENSYMDEDLLQALIKEYGIVYVADNIDDFDYYEGVYSEADLGSAVIESLGWDGISDEEKESYFDYEAFGRDLVIADGYEIDHGFAYRAASRTALAKSIHEHMLVAAYERAIKSNQSVRKNK